MIPVDAATFAYTPSALQVRVQNSLVAGGVRCSMVTFRSGSRTLTAEIVAPAVGGGKFEPDAIALARIRCEGLRLHRAA